MTEKKLDCGCKIVGNQLTWCGTHTNISFDSPMTETHSLGEWQTNYSELFRMNCTHPVVNAPLEKKTLSYIHSLLLAQKEGFRREIKETMKDITAHLEPGMNPRTQEEMAIRITNYNQGLKDLLTKLDTNV